MQSQVFFKSAADEIPQLIELRGYVTLANLTDAKCLLTEKPHLLLMQTTFTDPSENNFELTSAFQYAFWANDIDMLIMMKDFINEDMVELALEQLNETEEKYGHYEMANLINAIEAFMEEHIKPSFYNDSSRSLEYSPEFTRNANQEKGNIDLMNIGKIQNQAPVNVMQEFFRTERFSANCMGLAFAKKPLERTTILPLQKWSQEIIQKLRPERKIDAPNPLVYKKTEGTPMELGITYTIFRISDYAGKLFPSCVQAYGNLIPDDVKNDLTALKELQLTRTLELNEFKQLFSCAEADVTDEDRHQNCILF